MRIGKRVVREFGVLRLHVLELSHLPARIRNQVHVTVDQSRQHEARALVDDPLTARNVDESIKHLGNTPVTDDDRARPRWGLARVIEQSPGMDHDDGLRRRLTASSRIRWRRIGCPDRTRCRCGNQEDGQGTKRGRFVVHVQSRRLEAEQSIVVALATSMPARTCPSSTCAVRAWLTNLRSR